MAYCDNDCEGTGIAYIDFDADFTDENPAVSTFFNDESRFKETWQECTWEGDDIDEQI